MKLPWPSLQDCANSMFRALGLNLLTSVYRSLQHLAVGKGYEEHTKIAIRGDRTIASLRTLIHAAPVGVALWEIIINWNTYYLGSSIRSLAWYQVGAKTHEISAQASLATIVFTYIRHEMLLGQGLPLGALFSGLQVSQTSYLWSMEFWGLICSNHFPWRKRLHMIFIITIAVILAAAVGPSSAILLIPRLDYWPAGSTDIWLNATFQDLWPDQSVLFFSLLCQCDSN